MAKNEPVHAQQRLHTNFRHSRRGSVPQLTLAKDTVLFWRGLDTHRPIKSMTGPLMPLFGAETPVPSSSGTYLTHNGPESMSAAVRWRYSAMAPPRRLHLTFASLQLIDGWVAVAVERYRSISLRSFAGSIDGTIARRCRFGALYWSDLIVCKADFDGQQTVATQIQWYQWVR